MWAVVDHIVQNVTILVDISYSFLWRVRVPVTLWEGFQLLQGANYYVMHVPDVILLMAILLFILY